MKMNFLRKQRCDSDTELHACVSERAIGVWSKLPIDIRCDSSFALFGQEYERTRGNFELVSNDRKISQGSLSQNRSDSCMIVMKEESDGKNSKHIQNIGNNYATFTDCLHSHGPKSDAKTNSAGIMNKVKIALLITLWILFTAMLMLKDEKVLTNHQMTIAANSKTSYVLNEKPTVPRFSVIFYGAFARDHSNTTNFLSVQVQLDRIHVDGNNSIFSTTEQIISSIFVIPIIDNLNASGTAKEHKKSHTFFLDASLFEQIGWNDVILSLQIKSNLSACFPVNLVYDPSPIDKSVGIIYAAGILIGLYMMIIWEIIERTIAAMLASTLSIAVLALMNNRPTMPEISSWIDVETLLLLFGMMVLVGILSETGFFDYLAVFAFKVAHGEMWTLIYCLCLFTAFLSAILDNVTTLLLMAPISIRLCEIMELNPIPILTSMIIFSNIGGSMTVIGDPPNIIIASNWHVIKSGVNFLNFAIHMSTGAMFVMIQTFIQLRLKFRTINDIRVDEPEDIRELRHEIFAWQKAAHVLSPDRRDENMVQRILMKKIGRLQQNLKTKIESGSIPTEVFQLTLRELQQKYFIRNFGLLIKSAIALTLVIVGFFFHSLPYVENLSLGWTALLGVCLLLILADRKDIQSILAHVEWSTLLFFAVLFVLIESLAKLGLIDWIGDQTQNVILSVGVESQLTIAILLILWVSGIASAFVDNIPLTTMMIRVTISLAKSTGLPLQPLIWALSFGACLGGNGTLIGASANIVCASVAEQNGYRLTFMEYFKVAFPAMIGSLIVASGYLLVCHVGFEWH